MVSCKWPAALCGERTGSGGGAGAGGVAQAVAGGTVRCDVQQPAECGPRMVASDREHGGPEDERQDERVGGVVEPDAARREDAARWGGAHERRRDEAEDVRPDQPQPEPGTERIPLPTGDA